MPKRFTATEKWVDPWFCGLSRPQKLFWTYLLDNCNHAGIWQVNWPLVKFHLGDFEVDLEKFNGRIEVLSESKWFIPKFISFQYGELNPDNRAHNSVILILEREGAYKELNTPLLGCKDMVKDKVKDKNKGRQDFDFDMIWSEYPNKIGRRSAEKHFRASVKTLKDFTDIQGALVNYKSSKRVKSNYIQNGSTWFCNWRDWVELPKNEKFCDKCKGTGKFISATGFECVCDCGAK